jgi:hypothetical protein
LFASTFSALAALFARVQGVLMVLARKRFSN